MQKIKNFTIFFSFGLKELMPAATSIPKIKGLLLYKKYGSPSNKCWAVTDEGMLDCPAASVDQHCVKLLPPMPSFHHL